LIDDTRIGHEALRRDPWSSCLKATDRDRTSRTVLDNGTLVVARELSTATAAIVVEFACGSRDDPKGLDGLHHFLEHMVFQGAGERDVDAMAEAFEDLAADVNAATSSSFLRLEVTVMPRHVEEAMSLLADMALRPTFDEARIENERSVILQDIAANDEDLKVEEAAMSLAFEGDPISRRVAGSAKSMKSIARRHIVDQHATTFVGRRCTIAVTGPIDREAVLAATKRLFGPMPSGEEIAKRLPAVHRPGRRHMPAPGGRTSVRMTWPAVVTEDRDRNLTFVAMHILGNGPTSRLVRRLREKEGLCYTAWAYPDMSSSHGMATIGFETKSRKGRQAVAAVLDEIRRLSEDATEVELKRAKRAMEMSLLEIMDRPLSMATIVSNKARAGNDEPYDLIECVNSITLDEVKACLAAMTPDLCAASSLGGSRAILSDLPSKTR
jgi:predicted Zn-dependent peptidase